MKQIFVNAAEMAAMYAAIQAKVDRATAAHRPPQYWAVYEDLAVYCCGHGKDLIMVPAIDRRVAGDRAPNRCRAFYKE